MKLEDGKHCLGLREKYKTCITCFLQCSSLAERKEALGGGLGRECQLALGFILGKRGSHFFSTPALCKLNQAFLGSWSLSFH